jgi:hypothetical protein
MRWRTEVVGMYSRTALHIETAFSSMSLRATSGVLRVNYLLDTKSVTSVHYFCTSV